MNEKLDYLINAWGDLKFGVHCAELGRKGNTESLLSKSLKQMQQFCNAMIARETRTNMLTLVWHPSVKINTQEGQDQCVVMGADANQKAQFHCRSKLGTMFSFSKGLSNKTLINCLISHRQETCWRRMKRKRKRERKRGSGQASTQT